MPQEWRAEIKIIDGGAGNPAANRASLQYVAKEGRDFLASAPRLVPAGDPNSLQPAEAEHGGDFLYCLRILVRAAECATQGLPRSLIGRLILVSGPGLTCGHAHLSHTHNREGL